MSKNEATCAEEILRAKYIKELLRANRLEVLKMSSCTSNTFKKMDIDSFVDVIKLDTLSDFYDIF